MAMYWLFFHSFFIQEDALDIEQMSWYKSLIGFGFHEHEDIDPKDDDIKIIPSIIEKAVLTRLIGTVSLLVHSSTFPFIYAAIYPSIIIQHSFIHSTSFHSSIHSSTYPFIYASILIHNNIHPSTENPSIHSFIHLYIIHYLSIYSFNVHPFIHPPISSIRSFIHLTLIRPFRYISIHSFIHSMSIHSFIYFRFSSACLGSHVKQANRETHSTSKKSFWWLPYRPGRQQNHPGNIKHLSQHR